MRNKEKREAGFTLMEIMIVLAIIGLIMGVLVLPRLLGSGDKAKTKAAKIQIQNFALAYEEWSNDHPGEACPQGIEELINTNVKGKKQDLQKKDPWGIEFRIVCGDTAPEGAGGFGVTSAGADKKHDTSDDIKSWTE